MAIQAVKYDEGFSIQMSWPLGVKGTIIYCVARGDKPVEAEELMRSMKNNGLRRYNGFAYGSGTGQISYSPQQESLRAAWVDIWYCDYNMQYEVIRNELFGSFFNGKCRIGERIELIPISSERQAVQITLQNKSQFELAANGIGYSVNGRVYPIPLPIGKGARVELPQFDVGIADVVKLCCLDGSYPADFYELAE